MSNKSEVLYLSRKKIQIGVMTGFTIWYGAFIIKLFFPNLPNNSILFSSILILGLLGYGYSIINGYKMMKFNREIKKNPKLKEILEDELYQQTMLKSAKLSLITLIFTQPILMIINYFYRISTIAVLHFNIFIGVLSIFIFMLILGRE